VESAVISAPHDSTMRRTMASPSPVPLLRVEKRGSKMQRHAARSRGHQRHVDSA